MANSLQMNSGLDNKKFAILNKLSSYKGSCFQAKMVTLQRSGKANYYQVLSLDSIDVGLDEIKKAYRHKALKYHPDICCHASVKEESSSRFLEIKEAYETLSDAISRKIYDYQLCFIDPDGPGERNIGSNAVCFHKETWERQLQGLSMRSMQRMGKKRNH